MIHVLLWFVFVWMLIVIVGTIMVVVDDKMSKREGNAVIGTAFLIALVTSIISYLL